MDGCHRLSRRERTLVDGSCMHYRSRSSSKDSDRTLSEGHGKRAMGWLIEIDGHMPGTAGMPVADALPPGAASDITGCRLPSPPPVAARTGGERGTPGASSILRECRRSLCAIA